MLWVLLIGMQATAIAAQPAELDAGQLQRYHKLTEELRCLVCQNQNIAESNAPLANDLRDKVQEMLLAGRSDAEIKDYMTDHYGDFVLYRPPLKPATLALWFAPAVLLLAALLLVWRLTHRHRGSTSTTQVADAQSVQRILTSGTSREGQP